MQKDEYLFLRHALENYKKFVLKEINSFFPKDFISVTNFTVAVELDQYNNLGLER